MRQARARRRLICTRDGIPLLKASIVTCGDYRKRPLIFYLVSLGRLEWKHQVSVIAITKAFEPAIPIMSCSMPVSISVPASWHVATLYTDDFMFAT